LSASFFGAAGERASAVVPFRVKQEEIMQKEAYLVVISDGETQWVEAVSLDKVKAEATMRELKEQDKLSGRVYTYRIQVKPLI
jgi:hypothetical protein